MHLINSIPFSFLKNSLHSLLAILLLTGCTKEFDPNIEGAKDKIILNTFVNNLEVIKASVTKSFPINQGFNIVELADADVSLFENGFFLESLIYSKNSDDDLGLFTSSFIPKIDTEYRIDVEFGNLEKVTATATIPNGVSISNSNVEYLDGNSYKLNFNFQDPAEVNYYYMKMFFRGFKTDSVSGEKVFIDDFRIEMPQEIVPAEAEKYLDNGYVFKDDDYGGSLVEIAGIAKSGNIPGDLPGDINDIPEDVEMDSTLLFVRLETLSEEAYKFYYSHARSINADLLPGAEATSIFSNVQNGAGIMSGIFVSEVGIPVN